MRIIKSRWIALLLCMCILGIGPLNSVSAQEMAATPGAFVAPKFNIFPVGDFKNQWVEVTIESGQSVELIAGIRNSGKVSASLRTYATNASNPPNGGFTAGMEEDEPIGPALWLDYVTESFELHPGERREQPFTVTVPEGTPPGVYVAALAVQTSESLEIPGSDTLRQIIRGTMSVEITVPGEMTSGVELGTPAFSSVGAEWALDVPITNTGTARLRPAGELTVTGVDGKAIVEEKIEMGSVYGGNTTSVRVVLPAQVPFGEYRVSLELTDEATGASASLDNVPVTLAAPEKAEAPTFVVDAASIDAQGEPVQYADVAATITNDGPTIPTATITLNVQRDGKDVESYPLALNQALAGGTTEFTQRYIPAGGWAGGSYSFQLVVSSVSGGTETVLATYDVEQTIEVP